MKNSRLMAAIEAIVFARGNGASVKELKEALKVEFKEIGDEEIEMAIQELERHLKDAPGHGLELARVAGGIRLQTKPALSPFIEAVRSLEAPRLSRASLETLSIIAYKQPITKAEIEEIRGVDSSAPLRFLLEKGLVKIAGRKECPGRPLIYRTSRRFLELFGLESLKGLPRPKEA